MKKRTTAGIILCLVCLAMILSVVSCGNTSNTTVTTTSAADPAVTENPNDPKLPAIDWDGGEFHVVYNGGTIERNRDFAAEESNGEALNDAVYNRNIRLQEKYNFVLTYERQGDSTILSKVSAANAAGDEQFQLVECNQSYSMSLATKGWVHAYSELTCVDTSKPYWFTSALEGSSIAGENYFAYCDTCLYSFAETPCTIFNKTVAKNFNINNIYTLVESGDWTFAEMMTMAKNVTGDLDGDQKITKDDMLGQITGPFCMDCFLSGTGYQIITKDEKDLPVLNIQNDVFYNIVDSITAMVAPENGMLLGSRYDNNTTTNQTWPFEAMTQNRALFRVGNFFCVEELRGTECDYGVVPMPKLNSDQKDYKVHMQSNENGAISIPNCVIDPYNVSSVLEDIAFFSSETVMPTYMDVLIEGRSVRDVESLKCIKIIRNSYYCDMAFMMKNYGIDVLSLVRDIAQNNKSATTEIAKKAGSFNTYIQKFRKEFGE